MFQSWFCVRGRILGLAALTLFLGASTAFAQQSRVEGTVRHAQTRDPVENARVTVVGTTLFALTNENGYYAIESVAVGTYDVRVQVIGYQTIVFTNQRVAAGLPTTVNFQLQPSILRIEGVVVTGVAEATQSVKLPFTVDKLGAEELPVPAQNAEAALQGKVAGAKVVSAGGLPGSGTSVLLRGATSINTSGRTNEPLYVVDGVILGASMTDIDALDIESIEVVKGAAAAALYGARAANGVVQIQTRRGSEIPDGETRILFRSEYGQNALQKRPLMGTSHFYATDGTYWLDGNGDPMTTSDTTFNPDGSILIREDNTIAISSPRTNRVVDWHNDSTFYDADGDGTAEWVPHRYAVSDNDYPSSSTLYDQVDRLFNPGSFYTNSASVSHRTGTTNFRASFHETKETGILDGLDGYLRRGGRVNVDHRIGRTLDFSASGLFSQSEADSPFGDNPNPFFSLPRLEPDLDYFALYPEAQKKIDAGTASARDSVDYVLTPSPEILEENPLYLTNNQSVVDTRNRFLTNIRMRWRATNEFDLEGDFSYDRSDRNSSEFWFKGYRTFDPSTLRDGRLRKINSYSQALNGSATATFNKRFGELNTVTRGRVLVERQKNESATARATVLTVDRVEDLDNSNQDLQRVFGSTSEIRSLGYFISTQLDFKDRYIVDALVRRDGSSLFGPENRWNTYYRLGGAYRMSMENWWPLDWMNEFKLRLSRGTAGGRPSFTAQYETFNVSGSTVSKGTLGNTFLKPEHATETEVGVDMIVAGRLSLTVAYAASTIEDQLLQIPLPGFKGFATQWQNAGTLSTNTWEATLQWGIIQTPNVGWTANLLFDRTRGTIDSLGAPPYFTNTFFYVKKGDDLGTIYGSRWASACNDILTDGGFGQACDQFEVNDDGFFVPVGTGNTWTDGIDKHLYGSRITIDGVTYDWGVPVKSQIVATDTLPGGQIVVDTTDFQKIGSSMPDFNFAVGNTVRWKGFSLYALLDAQIGGDIYNQTRQWGCRDKTCWEYDQVRQSGELSSGSPSTPENQRKSILYPEILYDVESENSHFIEDGTNMKLREVSLRYTFNRGQMENFLGGIFNRISLSVVGRNLLTFTGYTGYDPEVGSGNNASFLRVDNFGYPNFRSFTGAVEIEF